ncbi:UDP-2,4-diacetamido-2,4,6-trideoxy-beta-L-altropyranose hydrolase [Desulfuromusa kysingii]|uniref:UDP-2,4-diacetamido-2,4,6-trideoxy-beta-L-altropyranose hydrolase n=1 Tax=Desulfuromusa kysingii TaxID=37625 RepID=A0A1H3VMH9_9BACT|nr:glycosyltransferase [Desulfuromusa kysingii]SDZ75911.1 UDP-2,4-diacetamido-2,4,6-trideoxy-beta-L-altropyranose hydrolase [Desulfuromusa kysingii]
MILFRCNANSRLGFGHLARCRALASAFLDYGVECGMVGPDKIYATESDCRIFKIWVPVLNWNTSKEDASLFVDIIHAHNGIAAVIDDYRVDEDYQIILRDAGVKWLQFEACFDKPIWADWLLYANPGAKDVDFYASMRRTDTILMVGAKYAILRKEFSMVVPKESDGIETLLVVFGGGDDRGAILFTLKEILNNFGEQFNVTVISGSGNPNNNELVRYIANCGENVNIIINPDDITKIMSTSDVAITSGGTLTYELSACNVPMVIIAISDDQKASLAWQNLNCGIYLGSLPDLIEGEITNALDRLLNEKDLIPRMKKSLSETVDGNGAERVSGTVLRGLGVL